MEKMKVQIAAFTGSRKGMTDAQKDTVRRLLGELHVTHFHHGAAIGADEVASLIARDLAIHCTARPGDSASDRSEMAHADYRYAPAPPLDRNKKLVDFAHFLIAAPDGPEQSRSGTWSTVRYAGTKKKPVWLVMPDGGVSKR